MWKNLPLEWKGILCGLLFGAMLMAFFPDRANAAERAGDVFTLFDKGVASLIANTSCGIEDPIAFEHFAEDFSKVASVAADELQRLNPERSRRDIDRVVGFRIAQLERLMTRKVKSKGCDAPDVKATRALFDMKTELAFLEGEIKEYSH